MSLRKLERIQTYVIKQDLGRRSAVDERLISDLSAVPDMLFVVGL